MDYNKVQIGNQAQEIASDFYKNISSDVNVSKELNGGNLDFSWVDKIYNCIPYLNKIFENPKRFIVNEELILDVGKSKKVTVDSVKHLAKHSNMISEYNEIEDSVKPDKLLNVLKEDTYNTYENRFIYTLIQLLDSFIYHMEQKMNGITINRKDDFTYTGNSIIDGENIKYNFNVKADKVSDFNKENPELAEKIANIKGNLSNWKISEMYASLKQEGASKVTNPIRRTNVILKNPNFQEAAKLWDYIYNYKEENQKNDNNVTSNDSIPNDLNKLVENTFLINYLVMKMGNSATDAQKQSYRSAVKKVAMKVFNDSSKLIDTLDEDKMKLEEQSDTSNDGKEQEINKNIISDTNIKLDNKIKSIIREYAKKIDESCFIIGKNVK